MAEQLQNLGRMCRSVQVNLCSECLSHCETEKITTLTLLNSRMTLGGTWKMVLGAI